MTLIAYTDGTTRLANPGPMAWAVVYVEDDRIIRETSGALYHGTNNKAEMLAVIWAMEYEDEHDLLIRTDSQLIINVASGLWKAKKNIDLWERFDRALTRRTKRGLVTDIEHVRAHNGNPFNERADRLARQAAIQAANCLEERKV